MKNNEIGNFLSKYYNKPIVFEDKYWEAEFINPIEIVDIMSCLVDNIDKYDISMWISLDEGMLIYVNSNNMDEIIQYLYDRFPY